MKSRPGIAAGFVVAGALASVIILGLSSIGGALNRSSDGAYAPSREVSEFWPIVLFLGYFVSGVFASFTEKREGRILWLAAAHSAMFFVWGSIVFPADDKAEAATFYWASQDKKNTNFRYPKDQEFEINQNPAEHKIMLQEVRKWMLDFIERRIPFPVATYFQK